MSGPGKINMEALGKQLGVDLKGFEVKNEDDADGRIEFQKKLKDGKCFSVYELEDGGKLSKYRECVKGKDPRHGWQFERFSDEVVKIFRGRKAKVLLGALGEEIDPDFYEKNSKEIEAKKASIAAKPKAPPIKGTDEAHRCSEVFKQCVEKCGDSYYDTCYDDCVNEKEPVCDQYIHF